jgi:hypothetical protein
MKNAQTLAAAILAVASLPLLAQQADPANPQQTTPSAQAPAAQVPPEAQPAQTNPSTAAVAAVELSPVNGELVDKLDTRTAKTGDSVVVRTKSNVKTADGTEIPKGSKLIGRVMQVKPSGDAKDNSQVALQFDRAELKGGQSLAIHSEIQSISFSNSDTPSNASDTMAAMPSGPSPSAGPTSSAPGGSMNGSASATANTASAQPQMSGGSPAANPSTGPAPGTVVARTGNIAIRTTSIPGVLLATDEPGQQDPRMAQASGIILGAKQDVHLEGGTKVVIGVASAQATAAGGGN